MDAPVFIAEPSRAVQHTLLLTGDDTSQSGTTLGLSPFVRSIKNAVIYGIMQGMVLAEFATKSIISSSGAPMWHNHSAHISIPVHPFIVFYVVAGYIGKEPVEPAYKLLIGLLF